MDYCPLCLRYDCPDPDGHAQALRMDIDTWPADGSEPTNVLPDQWRRGDPREETDDDA